MGCDASRSLKITGKWPISSHRVAGPVICRMVRSDYDFDIFERVFPLLVVISGLYQVKLQTAML